MNSISQIFDSMRIHEVRWLVTAVPQVPKEPKSKHRGQGRRKSDNFPKWMKICGWWDVNGFMWNCDFSVAVFFFLSPKIYRSSDTTTFSQKNWWFLMFFTCTLPLISGFLCDPWSRFGNLGIMEMQLAQRRHLFTLYRPHPSTPHDTPSPPPTFWPPFPHIAANE